MKEVKSPDEGNTDGEDDGERGHDERGSRPPVKPEPRARAARPPHLANHQRPAVEPKPRARAAPQPRQKPTSPTHRATLSAADLRLLDLHLAPTIPVSGQGMTVVPHVLVGLRGLAELGLPDQLLRGCDLKRLMKDELGIEFHCCSKTFGKALAAVAARTPLLKRVGKRWALPMGELLRVDSELLREIARLTRTAKAEAPGTCSSPRSPSPEPTATPTASTNSTAKTPKSPATQQRPAAAASPASAPDSPTVLTEDPPAPASEPGPPSPLMGESEGSMADHRSQDAPLRPEGSQEVLVDLEWLLANGHRHRPTRRRDGPLRVTLASVPDSESASRGPGWDPRGSPRWWWW